MSDIPPGQMAEVARILQELSDLRRRETELLEQLRVILKPEAAAVPAGSPAPSNRDWLDAAVDAALNKAFGAEVDEDEAGEGDEPPARNAELSSHGERVETRPAVESARPALPSRMAPPADAAADPDLLLLRSGELSAGFPWQQVAGIDLTEDAAPESAAVSLHSLLDGQNGQTGPDEPYRITWKTGTGTAALTCEFLAGVVSASVAASRGVELILKPSAQGSGESCRVLTLLDFLTGAADQGNGPEAPAPAPTVAGPASEPSPVAEPLPSAVPPTPPKSEQAPSSPDPEPARQPLPSPEAIVGPPIAPVPLTVTSVPPASRLGPAESPRGPALVAVRYLPARVAIARVLRSLGFFAAEAPDNQELPSHLQRGSYSVVFAEPPDPVDGNWLESLKRAQESGTAVVVVTSRLRARARDPLRLLHDAPRLYHPFREGEIERTLGSLRSPERAR